MSSIPNCADLLSIRALSVSIAHRLGSKRIIEDVSLDLAPGQIVGVVGESGAGKSTVGNAIIGLLDPPAQVDSGKIMFRGQDLVKLPLAKRAALRGREISMIFQDPQTALDPLMTIGAQLTETICLRCAVPAREARDRALELLHHVGIDDGAGRFGSFPHQFSGGMRQRVVIALALCAEPSIIVADEPTTALDVTLQSQILTLIRKACRERGLGVLLITHNMSVVSEVADRVIVMQNGLVVEQGATASVLGRPREPYTKALVAAVPRMEGTAATRPRRRPINVGEAATDTSENCVDVRNVTVSFAKSRDWLGRRRGHVRGLDEVTFMLGRGEALGIVGESGSGKSTLARCIAGITPPDSGSISILHSDASCQSGPQKLQMIFQDPYASLNPRLRISDIVGEALDYYGLCRSRAERDQKVAVVLKRVGLPTDAMTRYPHQFSGGQRQRISIARALILHPSLLICDEPTSALDVSVQQQILELLKELQVETNLSMLFISHDLAVVRQVCSRVAVMSEGRIIEIGETSDVFDRPSHPYTRKLLAAMPGTSGLAPVAAREDAAEVISA